MLRPGLSRFVIVRGTVALVSGANKQVVGAGRLIVGRTVQVSFLRIFDCTPYKEGAGSLMFCRWEY